jgi:hypothetical protein
MGKKKTNPRNIPKTQEDCNRSWREGCIEGLRLMEAIIMRVMIDKHPDEIDLNVLWDELNMYTKQWADGKLTPADIRQSLKTEDNIFLLDGPSKAIAHSRR